MRGGYLPQALPLGCGQPIGDAVRAAMHRRTEQPECCEKSAFADVFMPCQQQCLAGGRVPAWTRPSREDAIQAHCAGRHSAGKVNTRGLHRIDLGCLAGTAAGLPTRRKRPKASKV